ncbi:hypothetical protein ABH922_003918 [Rhodococcus sp. 27YEA15]
MSNDATAAATGTQTVTPVIAPPRPLVAAAWESGISIPTDTFVVTNR